MINLAISLAVALAVAAALAGLFLVLGFATWASLLPAFIAFLIVFLGVFVFLSRRIGRQIQAIAAEAQKELMAQRFDKGIKILESAFRFTRWQFFIAPELHANVGSLYFMTKKPTEARPHLEKSGLRGASAARARTMLATLHYQAKDEAKMRATFEQAVVANKKDLIAWAAYGWCLEKLGKRDDAIKVFSRAVEANPSEEKLKTSLAALKNDKKLKMKSYGLEWYQLFLEHPPLDMGGGGPGGLVGGGRKVIFQRR
ncbi:MAG: tetratricopeptide repeat protein [Myxococcales bacterium]|jgi:tetratricopeptide (TPR) repeat protein|nr:tetratricopeptide repeat protein [Myxococcales bacterium]